MKHVHCPTKLLTFDVLEDCLTGTTKHLVQNKQDIIFYNDKKMSLKEFSLFLSAENEKCIADSAMATAANAVTEVVNTGEETSLRPRKNVDSFLHRVTAESVLRVPRKVPLDGAPTGTRGKGSFLYSREHLNSILANASVLLSQIITVGAGQGCFTLCWTPFSRHDSWCTVRAMTGTIIFIANH
ncbi:hypothetical protein AGDE_16821 [Angomonas deanei]|nr:hypothetical protein AGDE_16821 [Angomonas deanei]|eukprot:EPY16114.1 hypothetical protein AGDE_16821 [Angomonas deanei]